MQECKFYMLLRLLIKFDADVIYMSCYLLFTIFVKIAISMADKAASLARELRSVKSDLCFLQQRCALLEAENGRFRDGYTEGIRPEEDDLVSYNHLIMALC